MPANHLIADMARSCNENRHAIPETASWYRLIAK